jgi:hypothetical protein
MKQTIDSNDFTRAFFDMNRQHNFSYEGLALLFDHLEECDPEMELDVVAICCDYSEDMPEDIVESYGIEYDDTDPGALEAATAYLEANSTIVGVTPTGSIVYASNF